jgi:hypothetical protein
MGQVLEAQGLQITALTSVTDDQLSREKEYNALTGDQGRMLSDLEAQIDNERRVASEFRRMPFLARLRWFLTGR